MSSYVTADDLADRLEGAKRMAGGWVARCPGHDDRHASLKIAPGQKATVLFCHAGCTTEDVLMALGMTPDMLFYDYGVKNWQDRNEINLKMREMIDRHRPYQPDWNLYRLDDVMWEALVTEKSLQQVPEKVWYESMVRAGVNWAFLMSCDYTEAMMYPVMVQDGPLFDFLQPLWEQLGRPSWYALRDHAMKEMRKTYHDKGGRREPTTRYDLDWQLTGGPLL